MGKNQSASGLTNIIQYDNRGNISFVSGSTTLMQVSSSGAITTTGTISGGAAADALLLNGTGSLAFVTTASYNVASASFSSRTTQVEKTYATTGSNTFTGPQFASNTSNAISFTSTASLYSDGGLRVQGNSFVSGTAYFNNIVVYGTSSVQYITSSQVNVGTNIITVNTDTPAVRFGGLAVFDSGSTQLTGSMLWDSEKNHWVYSNPSGSTYSGGMFISGPRSSALGSEQGTTACMLLVGQGGDHLTSSLVYHDSARTCFYGNALFVTSSGNVGIGTSTPTGGISGTETALEISNSNVGVLAITSTAASGKKYQIYSSNDGGLFFRDGTCSTQRMMISTLGNVGIGTTSVTQPSAGATTLRIVGTTTSKAGAIYLDSSDSSVSTYIYPDATNGLSINTSTNHPIVFRTTDCERMRITSNGNIGIGNSSPSYQLDMCSGTTVNQRIRLQRGSDDTNQNMLLGWNNITVTRSNVSISGNQTDFSIIQCGSDGARVPFNIGVGGHACFACPMTIGTSCRAFGRNLTVQGDIVAYFSNDESVTMGISAGTGAQSWGIQVCDTGDGSNTLHLNARGGFVGINKGAGIAASYPLDVTGVIRATGNIIASCLSLGSIAHYTNYISTSGCFAIFCASQGAILYVTSMHNNGRATYQLVYSNGPTGGASISVNGSTSAYGPASTAFGLCANGWVYGYQQYGGPTDFYAIAMNSNFQWAF